MSLFQTSALRLGLITVIAITLILAVVAWRPPSRKQDLESSGKSHPAVGKEFLPKRLPPLTAKAAVADVDLKGKVVLVNFWGYWCGPCKIEFPHLMELEKSLRAQADFRFVSVACPSDPDTDEEELRDKTQAFLSERQAEIVTYADPEGAEQLRLAEVAGDSVLGYPLTVVIGRDGRIRGVWLGYEEGYELQMRAVIDECSSGNFGLQSA